MSLSEAEFLCLHPGVIWKAGSFKLSTATLYVTGRTKKNGSGKGGLQILHLLSSSQDMRCHSLWLSSHKSSRWRRLFWRTIYFCPHNTTRSYLIRGSELAKLSIRWHLHQLLCCTRSAAWSGDMLKNLTFIPNFCTAIFECDLTSSPLV